MNIDLRNKHILVTGASRGIGKAIVFHLKDSGAVVHAHTRNGNEFDNSILECKAELTNRQEVVQLFEKVIKSSPTLDTVILNAGIFESHSCEDNLETWLETWDKTINVNLTSAAILSKMAIEHFRKIGGGRLIFISSRAASRGETAEYLAYAASKGGLTSLAKSIARSFGKENIKAFVVAPGFINTDMAKNFIMAHGEEAILKELALNELTETEHLTPLITLLASGMMDHATGTTIDVNAGSYMR